MGRFDADRAVERGVRAEQRGDVGAAERAYREVLARDPRHAGAHAQLGGLLAQSGRLEAALPHLEAARDGRPGDRSPRNNLGHVYRELGRLREAEAVFAELVAEEPAGWALYGLGVTRQQSGDLAGARQALTRAVAAGFSYGRLALAAVEELEGRPDRAIQTLTSALAESTHVGTPGRVRCRLGVLHVFHGNRAVGVAMLRAALQDDPSDAIARHMLAAVTGEAPEHAPDAFVAEVFDHFAAGYDTHLRDVLETRVPDWVAGATDLRGSVLDLGCGTGLAVRALGDRAERAVGVDLSPRMVQIARQSGLYAEVHCASLTDWLAGSTERFDLVLAADVLVYVGALEGLFAAVRPVCAGRFVLTVEAGEPDLVLCPTGRYAHGRAYVERCAVQAGFSVQSVESGPLRKEAGSWVDGALYVLAPTDR
ncbi:MAG: tetratricopeptide repeat protein [Myxococcota bacterium]